MRLSPYLRLGGALLFTALVGFVPAAHASSHREALAILNEPCADNTDTFAWVSNGTHDKLYLIMDYNPLHEPGQGNQGFRACNGYRYEFHIGKGASLADVAVYRVEFKNTLAPSPAPTPNDSVGGGNELLWQLTGGTETMTVTRVVAPGQTSPTVLGSNIKVLPNNHGPQTDRLVYGLAPFKGYDSGDRTSRENGLFDQTFIDSFIATLSNGARIIAGDFDDPYQLDEKGIFDLVNLGASDLGGIAGARKTPIEDVFAGYNVSSIALEVPTSELFPNGIPHNGTLDKTSVDSLLRVWVSISRQEIQTVDPTNIITGLRGSGNYTQVGRNALPLFNAGLVGTQRQTLYLHTDPMKDVTRFGNDVLFPVLVRDLDALGVYKALGVPAAAVTTLKGPRLDIINAINLGRPIPVADGSTGDVITLDAATDSAFPNGRRLGGGAKANMHQVNVNSVLISLIAAGDPAAGLAKGVETNDKDFLPRFPFLAPPHQGLLQGHGGTNATVTPVIPDPNATQPCQ
ncbi:MAG TPA: DUF4331 family protein [Thermoanaerobaculia bacterium]|nr:DUF4331 family protein [Thermoanaerobaculia bacterium]